MAGLTLAPMSLGLVDLQVLIKFGLPQDDIRAGTLPRISVWRGRL